MQSVIIHRSSFDEIAPYKQDAESEHLCFSDNTIYYGAYKYDTMLLGFTGIVWYKNKAKFKNHYVLPEYRGQGIFRKMMEHHINLVALSGIKKIEATCTDMSLPLYLEFGANIVKQYKTFTKVEISL